MLELVRELREFLSKGRLTVEETVRRVGPIKHDPGIPSSIELQSKLAGVRSAQLGRYPDSGLPYVLTLEPAVDSRPTAGALKGVLGDYKRARTDRGIPWELVFSPAKNAAGCQVTVMVTLEKAASDIDSARVTTIAFRRDPPPQ